MTEKKKKSLTDYSHLARKITGACEETSGDGGISKLPEALVSGLYIVATPIGHLGDISLRALVTLMGVDRIACEDTRNSGSLLNAYGIKKPLLSYHDHNADERRPEIMLALSRGESIALISDAGMPLIADPGYKLVRDCLDAGYNLVVIPGANAALTGLSGSGLPTDRFTFAGFLPPKKVARQKALALLKEIPTTLIFYEAPQRLNETLADCAKVLGATRQAVVARELTKLFEETKRGTLAELADFYADNNPKGEIVILIGPPDESAAPVFDLDALLQEALKTQTLRDAVSAVADMTGMKKNDVYARALVLSREK